MKTTDDLKHTREDLAHKVENLYCPDDFPGSRAWRAHLAAERALRDFDAAHPEIVAEIRAARATAEAARHAYWQSPEGREKAAGL